MPQRNNKSASVGRSARPQRDDVPLRWAVPTNDKRDEELREELTQVREAERQAERDAFTLRLC